MKIQCDVCNKDDASVFCTADQAALCDGCDHRVHHANKLASKHQRFSLIHPSSSKESPLCDICQERRAFLFCQQDRAILCRECDGSIHSANEHTQKHNRYLFTGVKLSATSTVYASSDSAAVTDLKPQPLINKKPISVSSAISSPPSVPKISTSTSNGTKNGGNLLPYDGVGSMSSISEYLTETLPGWHVEDLLDFSSNHPFGFCKADNGALPFFDDDIESNLSSFSSENNMGIWVPQAPNPSLQHSQMGFKETTKEATNMNTIKANYNNNYRSLWNDDGFTVPQISPPSVGSKRSRPF